MLQKHKSSHICKRQIEWSLFYEFLFFFYLSQCYTVFLWYVFIPLSSSKEFKSHLSLSCQIVSKAHLPFVLTNNQLKSIYQMLFSRWTMLWKIFSLRIITQSTEIMTINFFLSALHFLLPWHQWIVHNSIIIQMWIGII